MKLSKNFSLEELTKSDLAIRLCVDNTPDETVTANLQKLVDNILQPLRDKFGPVIISSGYRSPEVNSKVGGSKTSHHCFGYAADIEIPGVDNKDLALYIKDNFKFTQLILEFYKPGVPDSGWVHVAYNEDDLKGQELTATKESGKTHYKPGIVF